MAFPFSAPTSIASLTPKIIGDYGVNVGKPSLLTFDFNFIGEQQYNVNLQLMQMAQTFGLPRSIYVNNKYNPNEVIVYIGGSQEVLSIPAFCIGMLPVSALANDVIAIYSLGGTPAANPNVHVEIYNYERAPYTYSALAPFATGSAIQALLGVASSIIPRNVTLSAGVASNVFPSVSTARNIRFRNVGDGAGGGDVAYWQVAVTATGNFAAGDGVIQPGEEALYLPFTTAQRVSFFSAAGTRIEAMEWAN